MVYPASRQGDGDCHRRPECRFSGDDAADLVSHQRLRVANRLVLPGLCALGCGGAGGPVVAAAAAGGYGPAARRGRRRYARGFGARAGRGSKTAAGTGGRSQPDAPASHPVGRVLVSGGVRAAGRNGNRVADHPPYPVYDGPGVFRCTGGGFIHHLQRLRFSGQTGLGVSGRPVSGARDGGSGIGWQRRQYFRRRGGGECVADAYHIRCNVWFHRRRSGGHQPPALGRPFRAAAPGRHTGSVERRFPDGQHWRANVRCPGL